MESAEEQREMRSGQSTERKGHLWGLSGEGIGGAGGTGWLRARGMCSGVGQAWLVSYHLGDPRHTFQPL